VRRAPACDGRLTARTPARRYCLPNGDSGIIRTLDSPVYITRVFGNIIYCLDRDGKNRQIQARRPGAELGTRMPACGPGQGVKSMLLAQQGGCVQVVPHPCCAFATEGARHACTPGRAAAG